MEGGFALMPDKGVHWQKGAAHGSSGRTCGRTDLFFSDNMSCFNAASSFLAC